MAHEHDSGYKFLFSSPEMVRDLILGFVPDAWLHSLDYSTLEKVPGSYVSEDFKNRADDVVWRVRVGGQWVYLYLLIEFQSSVDKYMAVRMLVYLGLLYQDLIRRGEVLSDGALPPVLPIVLYNGSARWTAACDVRELIPPVPGLVEQYKPHLQYLLIDENAYSDHELASLKNLVAAVFRIEHPDSPAAMGALLTSLNEWLADRPDLRRMFAVWIRATLMRKAKYRIVLPQVEELQELRIMLADKLEQWALDHEARGMEKGRREGVHKGEALALCKLLARRFGAVPDSIGSRIEAASLEQIETWFDRAVDAASLAEIFGAMPDR